MSRYLRRAFRLIRRGLEGANRLLGRISARRLPESTDRPWSGNARDVIGLRSKEH